MKYIEDSAYGDFPTVELTRRNLQALLDKLDDPYSNRTLIDGDRRVAVRSIEDDGVLIDADGRIAVRAVPDDEHYANRAPGTVFMPSTGEYR